MQRHREILDSGQSVDQAFLCRVPDATHRKTVDREHYSILKFISHYNDLKGDNILFYSYNSQEKQPPDFTVITPEQSRIGIEITELQENEDVNKEAKAAEKLLSKFKKIPININFTSRPSLQKLKEKKKEFEDWLDKEINYFRDAYKDKEEIYIAENKNLELKIELSWGNPEGMNVFCWNMESPQPEYGNSIAKALSIEFVKRLKDKIRSPRKPSIRPCFLVMYFSGNFIAVEERTLISFVKLKIESDKIDYKSHFDEIWFLNDSKVFRLDI